MNAASQPTERSARLAAVSSANAADAIAALVKDLCDLAEHGLPSMFRARQHEFAFTRRGRRSPAGSWQTRIDGASVRYGAIAALGAQYLPVERQRTIFGGESVAEFCTRLVSAIGTYSDLGEVALITWLAAEIGDPSAATAFEALEKRATAAVNAPTVETAWALTATAAFADPRGRVLASMLVSRLLASRGRDGVLFPHNVAPSSQPWYRSQIGCFADQVYPIQSLARHHLRTGDAEALDAADACAKQICALQGSAGQWWWHYDWKRGDVVEGYPVYSVHQHAMAPMALFDLVECGGTDLSSHIRAGVGWLGERPETTQELINDELCVVWRKVARREPRPKLVRALRAAARPAHVSGLTRWLDLVARPGVIDFECRPYELGWLLYAWRHRVSALESDRSPRDPPSENRR